MSDQTQDWPTIRGPFPDERQPEIQPQNTLCSKCFKLYKTAEFERHKLDPCWTEGPINMSVIANLPRAQPNHELRPFIVGYMPSRRPGTLSYHASEIDPVQWKNEKIVHGSLPMAWKPVKPLEAVSEQDAIAKFKVFLTEYGKSKGKTYSQMAEIMASRY